MPKQSRRSGLTGLAGADSASSLPARQACSSSPMSSSEAVSPETCCSGMLASTATCTAFAQVSQREKSDESLRCIDQQAGSAAGVRFQQRPQAPQCCCWHPYIATGTPILSQACRPAPPCPALCPHSACWPGKLASTATYALQQASHSKS